MRIHLTIEGMHCAGCARAVERVLKAQPDVREASVDLAAGRATVEAASGADAAALAAAVAEAGYGAKVEAAG